MLAEKAYAKDVEELRTKLGLDRPLFVQYFEWLGRVSRGDFGESLWTRRPVLREIGQRLPVTMELAVFALAFALLIALPVGVLSAARQDTIQDYVARSAAIFGLSVPGFWLATLLIVLPAIWWGWRPVTEFTEFSKSPLAHVAQYLLPALILGIGAGAALMRLTRGMLLEVLRQDYVRTAWAKGLGERVIVLKHGLRNAIIPVVTLLGTQLPQIFGGTVVIETVFGLPGMSRFLFDTIRGARMRPPSAAHWLGTDNLSRDMWSRIVYGARVSVTVGFATIGLAIFLASVIGVSSGYFGGAYDLVVQRIVDAWLSFPYLVIILSVMAVLGPGLLNLVVALTILSAAINSRVIRGATIAVAQGTYVEAARALGCGHARIITRHILPNVTATIIILATIGLGAVTLAESALSFLGFGVPPPFPSWGAMLSGSGRTYMFRAPWMAVWPGVAISLAVFGFNMLGDALRDVLDPRLRGGAR